MAKPRTVALRNGWNERCHQVGSASVDSFSIEGLLNALYFCLTSYRWLLGNPIIVGQFRGQPTLDELGRHLLAAKSWRPRLPWLQMSSRHPPAIYS